MDPVSGGKGGLKLLLLVSQEWSFVFFCFSRLIHCLSLRIWTLIRYNWFLPDRLFWVGSSERFKSVVGKTTSLGVVYIYPVVWQYFPTYSHQFGSYPWAFLFIQHLFPPIHCSIWKGKMDMDSSLFIGVQENPWLEVRASLSVHSGMNSIFFALFTSSCSFRQLWRWSFYETVLKPPYFLEDLAFFPLCHAVWL